MKALLMVEREGRVVCAKRWNSEPDLSSFHWAVYLEGRTNWLVEAESAEAARALIMDARLGFGEWHPLRSGHVGRILASGGRS